MQKTLAFSLWLLALGCMPVTAQRVLSLDSCRAMALRNNKQMSVSQVKQEVARNLRKSARTKYLPHVSALGGYVYTSKEISILSDEQKNTLNNIGTNLSNGIQGKVASYYASLPSALQEALAPAMAKMGGDLTKAAGALNHVGMGVVDAFHTDTRHTLAGAVVVTQPLFMGGSIIAMNKLADINEQFAQNSAEAKRQTTLFQIDQVYWQVVSLRHKQKLAQSFLDLVKKLDDDVQKMIREGVATRSEGLSVSVKVNEAEMTLMKVDDGLALSRMLLCQLCGLPVNEQVTLVDEEADHLSESPTLSGFTGAEATSMAMNNRPEQDAAECCRYGQADYQHPQGWQSATSVVGRRLGRYQPQSLQWIPA